MKRFIVLLAVLAFTAGTAIAQEGPNMFPSIDAARAAYENLRFSYYSPKFFDHHDRRPVNDTTTVRKPLPYDALVELFTADGWQWVVQPSGTPYRWEVGASVPYARDDCGNAARRVIFMTPPPTAPAVTAAPPPVVVRDTVVVIREIIDPELWRENADLRREIRRLSDPPPPPRINFRDQRSWAERNPVAVVGMATVVILGVVYAVYPRRDHETVVLYRPPVVVSEPPPPPGPDINTDGVGPGPDVSSDGAGAGKRGEAALPRGPDPFPRSLPSSFGSSWSGGATFTVTIPLN